MKGYRRLTQEDRYQIEALKKSGMSLRGIAGIVGCSPSSVSRELKRNTIGGSYRAVRAQRLGRERRQAVGPPSRIDYILAKKIKVLLSTRQLSPEQIRAYLLIRGIFISTETIYKYIYAEHRRGGNLYLNLRRHRKYRMTRKASFNYRKTGFRVNQSWIAERPKVVEKRLSRVLR